MFEDPCNDRSASSGIIQKEGYVQRVLVGRGTAEARGIDWLLQASEISMGALYDNVLI